MITDSIVRLVLSGKVDVDTATVKVLMTQEPVALTEASTTVDVVLANQSNLSPDPTNVAGGFPARLRLDGNNLVVESVSQYIEFGTANKVSTIITYLAGTYGGITNPLITASQVLPDFYYTVAGVKMTILSSARG